MKAMDKGKQEIRSMSKRYGIHCNSGDHADGIGANGHLNKPCRLNMTAS